MTNPVIVTIEDNKVVVRTPQATVTVEANCPPCPDCSPPFECEDQSSWSSGQPVVFGFIPFEDATGNTAFTPLSEIGETLGALPESVVTIENSTDTDAIRAVFERAPHLSSARSATVVISSSIEEEAPLTFEVTPNANGQLAGEGTGAWQLEPGQVYCVTITPAWGE